MSDSRCPKCGSGDVIPNVHVHGDFRDHKLIVEIVDNPDAWVDKGVHESTLASTMCGQRGFVELYAKNPAELLKAYGQKQKLV